MPATTRLDYVHRLRGLRAFLAEHSLGAFVTTYHPHVRYLTGFSGSNGLAIVTGRRQYLLTDYRYETQSRAEVRGWDILLTRTSLIALAAKRRLLRQPLTVGIEAEYCTIAGLGELKREFPGVAFRGVRDAVETLAAVKDEGEISFISRAAAITDSVFNDLLAEIGPGARESELAARIGYLHRTHGGERDAFEPIVVSGRRGALPHGRASSKKLRKGELVTLDFGCVHHGYCSDLTRTVAVGKPSSRLTAIYATVLEAQEEAIAAARPGLPAKDLDNVARRIIERRGYGRYFKHSLGHGLGLEIHSYPKVTPTSDHILEPGNVVTIEPGIYIEGVGGVRIEDDIVVRSGGCDVLTKAPKNLLAL